MGDFEDEVQKLRDIGRDDLADKVNQFSNKEMRKRIGHVIQVEREHEELRAEIERVKAAPLRDGALESVGVDLGALSLAEQEVLETQRPDEYDEDWARSMVQTYHLPLTS